MLAVVTGTGHAATKWIAMVLDRPEQGVSFEHEPLMRLMHPSWVHARKGELDGDGSFFDSYWLYVRHKLSEYSTYGDAMSWEPIGLPMVNDNVPIDHVVFLVRHGIPQLHSIHTQSLWNAHGPSSWLYDVYLRRYWELAGKPEPDWSTWSQWEALCLWWNTNWLMPSIVKSWLPDAKVNIVCMEDLVGNVDYLDMFCRSFGVHLPIQRLRKLQSNDVNRKVKGSRDPAVIWKQWTIKQRSVFRRLCGSGMDRLGYSIP